MYNIYLYIIDHLRTDATRNLSHSLLSTQPQVINQVCPGLPAILWPSLKSKRPDALCQKTMVTTPWLLAYILHQNSARTPAQQQQKAQRLLEMICSVAHISKPSIQTVFGEITLTESKLSLPSSLQSFLAGQLSKTSRPKLDCALECPSISLAGFLWIMGSAKIQQGIHIGISQGSITEVTGQLIMHLCISFESWAIKQQPASVNLMLETRLLGKKKKRQLSAVAHARLNKRRNQTLISETQDRKGWRNERFQTNMEQGNTRYLES